jgi:hypothetical protein
VSFKPPQVLADSFNMRLLAELSDPCGFQPRSEEMPEMTPNRLVSWLRIVEHEERNDMGACVRACVHACVRVYRTVGVCPALFFSVWFLTKKERLTIYAHSRDP